jgi:hypothetical protein
MLITLHTTIQIRSHSSLKIIQIITITMSTVQPTHTETRARVNELITRKFHLLPMSFVIVEEAIIIRQHQRARVVPNRRLIRALRNGNQVSCRQYISYISSHFAHYRSPHTPIFFLLYLSLSCLMIVASSLSLYRFILLLQFAILGGFSVNYVAHTK